jgi:DNA-binding transcriptional ArsR family regulator
MELKTAVAALAALAQETRLAAYRLLVQAGPAGLAAGRIAEALGVSPATLSFHLKEMAYAGLIQSRQDSRWVIYSAHYEQMNALLAFLSENCCAGSGSPSNPPSPCCPATVPEGDSP